MAEYETKYCSVADVQRESGITFTNSTNPSIEDVLHWLESMEAEIDAKHLGWGEDRDEGEGYLASNVYLNVVTLSPRITPVERFQILTKYSIDPYWHSKGAEIVIPALYRPIISITSLSYTTKNLDAEPVWTALTEGYYTGWAEAAGTDYKTERELGKAGQEHIIGIYFYSGTRPDIGRARIKATFEYGWNLPDKILRPYCANLVAAKALDMSVLSGEPTRLSGFTGGDLQEYMNTMVDNEVRKRLEEAQRLQKMYFPTDISIGVLFI